MKRIAFAVSFVCLAAFAVLAFPTRIITTYNQTLWKDVQYFEKPPVLQAGVGDLLVDGGLHTINGTNAITWNTVDAGTGTSTVNVAITSGYQCACSSSTGLVAVRCTPDAGTLTVRSAADTSGVAICL